MSSDSAEDFDLKDVSDASDESEFEDYAPKAKVSYAFSLLSIWLRLYVHRMLLYFSLSGGEAKSLSS
jgi:hypothetical protein